MFQPFGNHFLFEDDFYLVLRQVTPIHFLQPDFITGERVVYQYAVVTGYDDDALEELHELGGGVVAALAGGTQVQLKIGNEHRRYLLNGYVRYVVLALNELGKVAAGDFVLAVGRYRLGYAHKLLHIVIVLLEQGKDGFVALAMPQKLVLHFLGGHVVVTPLHFVVNGVQRCVYIIQHTVYAAGFRSTSGSLAHFTVPNRGQHVQLGIKTARHTVHCNTGENGVRTVGFLLVFLCVKANVECRFHNSLL